jgi:hypothetical protein
MQKFISLKQPLKRNSSKNVVTVDNCSRHLQTTYALLVSYHSLVMELPQNYNCSFPAQWINSISWYSRVILCKFLESLYTAALKFSNKNYLIVKYPFSLSVINEGLVIFHCDLVIWLHSNVQFITLEWNNDLCFVMAAWKLRLDTL